MSGLVRCGPACPESVMTEVSTMTAGTDGFDLIAGRPRKIAAGGNGAVKSRVERTLPSASVTLSGEWMEQLRLAREKLI